MSLLYLVPSLELSPMGDDEFGPSTKYGMPRKIIQKLPRWASRLPLLEVSRLHLLRIKVGSWNGLSSDAGAASDSGPAERRPPPPGHVPSGALLSHPPAPSPLPLGPLPQAPGGSALPSSTAGLPSVPSRHLCPFSFLSTGGREQPHSSPGPLAYTSLQRSEELRIWTHTASVQIPAQSFLAVRSWGGPSPSLEKVTVTGPRYTASLRVQRS